jgi:hypothetical protein
MFSKSFPKIMPFMRSAKYGRVRWAPDDNIIGHRKGVIYMWDI